MGTPSPHHVTRLLIDYCAGRSEALDDLLPIIYGELHRLARQQRRFRRTDHTLNTTALVHEAYLKLISQEEPSWNNRTHFMRVASKAMRQILVDYARHRHTLKRGGAYRKVSHAAPGDAPLEERLLLSDERSEEVLAVDEALEHLAAFDERLAQIVELRYFAGFTIPETAEALDLSPTTVKREWATARAWLYRALGPDGPAI